LLFNNTDKKNMSHLERRDCGTSRFRRRLFILGAVAALGLAALAARLIWLQAIR
jgi:hypothetical protein